MPIECSTGARQEGRVESLWSCDTKEWSIGSRKCQSHRCSDGGVVVKEDAPSLSPQYSNTGRAVRLTLGSIPSSDSSVWEDLCQHESVDVGSQGELGGNRCGDSVSDNVRLCSFHLGLVTISPGDISRPCTVHFRGGPGIQ